MRPREFKSTLQKVRIPADAQVDHYLSKHHPDPARRRAQRPLAYEWSNLRYGDASVNSRKGNHDEAVLDPYEVGEGWFALDGALELTITEACPPAERGRAAFTIKTLGLSKGRVAKRLRQHFLDRYEREVKNGMDPVSALSQLDSDAPLLADYLRTMPVAVAP